MTHDPRPCRELWLRGGSLGPVGTRLCPCRSGSLSQASDPVGTSGPQVPVKVRGTGPRRPVRPSVLISPPSPQTLVDTPGEDDSEQHFRRITEMTILTIKLIVEFSKCLTGFDRLVKDDQITLLKVSAPCQQRRSVVQSFLLW